MEIVDLIDDYLTNRLNEQDKLAFENKMSENPELKAEVEIQKGIIEGLKKARVAELKAMLNKVPVSTPTIYFTPLRIAAALIGTAVMATGLYFYFENGVKINPNELSSSIVDSIRQSEDKDNSLIKTVDSVETIQSPIKEEIRGAGSKDSKNLTPQSENTNETSEGNKPAIEIIDPTGDLESSSPNGIVNNTKSIHVAKIDVEVNSKIKKYNLHYQFIDKKLVLYGAFDKNLYEIIEVNGSRDSSLFLYYKASYFTLNSLATEITPLKEIVDKALLEKLKAYRTN